MQTKEQWKRHWKVIAATTAVSALGLGGAAIADSRDDSAAPAAIALSERASVKMMTNRSLPAVFSNLGAEASDDPDSPFDDQSTASGQGGSVGTNSPDANSPDVPSAETSDSPDSPGTADSYDVAPAAPTPADSPGSVDSGSFDSGASGSADS